MGPPEKKKKLRSNISRPEKKNAQQCAHRKKKFENFEKYVNCAAMRASRKEIAQQCAHRKKIEILKNMQIAQQCGRPEKKMRSNVPHP